MRCSVANGRTAGTAIIVAAVALVVVASIGLAVAIRASDLRSVCQTVKETRVELNRQAQVLEAEFPQLRFRHIPAPDC